MIYRASEIAPQIALNATIAVMVAHARAPAASFLRLARTHIGTAATDRAAVIAAHAQATATKANHTASSMARSVAP